MPKTSTNETEGTIDNYDIDYIYNTFGNVDFGSNIVPNVHNAYTLGSSSFFWNTGFITSINTAQLLIPNLGPLTIKNHLLPDLDNTWDLGSTSYRFRKLFVGTLDVSQITGNTFSSSTGPLTFTTPNVIDPVIINRDLVPALNNTYRVGTTALKWLAVYGTTIFSNSVDGAGQPIIFNGSLRPVSSGTYFLGSSDRTWSQGYINTLFGVTVNTNFVSGRTSTNLTLTTASPENTILVDRHFLPSLTASTNLGSTTNRFATVFAGTVDVPVLSSNTVTASSGNLLLTTPLSTDLLTTDRNFAPTVNEGNDLGVSGQRWANVRAANVITNLIGNGVSTLSLDSSIAPLSDLTKSVGTSVNRFLEANIETVKSETLQGNTITTKNHQDLLLTTANSTHIISVNRSVLPSINGSLDLGTASLRYNNLFCNVINAPAFNVDTISTNTSTDLTLTTQSSSHAVITPRNFIPTVDNTKTLGTTSLRWSQAYATTVFTGTVSNSGSPILFNGSLRPSSDNSFQIGTTGLRYFGGYIRQVYADQYVETPQIRAAAASDLTLSTLSAGNSIIAQRNILPLTTNSLNLGSSAVRWGTVFATSLDATSLAINTLSSSSGNLTLTTPLTSDSISLTRNTIPAIDNNLSLGTSTSRWMAVYAPIIYCSSIDTGIGGSLSLSGSLIPTTDNIIALGNSGARFTAAHVTTLSSTTVNVPTVLAPATTNLTLSTTTATNNIITNRTFLPSADNTLNLGSPAARFANVYAANLNFAGFSSNTVSSVDANLLLTTPLSTQTVTTNRNFTPTVNNTQTLGTTALKWSSVNATTGFFSTISNNNSWITVAGGFLPNFDDLHWIGDVAKRYQRIYGLELFGSSLASQGVSNLFFTTPSISQKIVTDRIFEPVIDNTVSVGSSSKRFGNIYGSVVNSSNVEAPTDLRLSSAGGSSYKVNSALSIVPELTNTVNLGSSSLMWNNSYTNNTFTNTLRGATGAITLHNSLLPTSNNSLNLGSGSLKLNTIHVTNVNCSSLQNQSGTEVTCSEHFIPTTTASFDLGTTLLRWRDLFLDNVYTKSLKQPPSWAGITTNGSLSPELDSTDDLGSVTKRYNWIYNRFFSTEQISSTLPDISVLTNLIPSGIKSLGSSSTPWSQLFVNSITLFADFLPFYPNISNLGSGLQYWATGFFETVKTRILESRTSSIILLSDINPLATLAINLGKENQMFNSVWSESMFTPKTASYGRLSSPIQTITSTTNQVMQITVDLLSSYVAAPNTFGFPTKGVYLINLNLRADVDTVTPNYLKFSLFRSNNSTYYGHAQYYDVGYANFLPLLVNTPQPQYTITFTYVCLDTADRIQIHVQRGGSDVTGVALNDGSMIVRVSATD